MQKVSRNALREHTCWCDIYLYLREDAGQDALADNALALVVDDRAEDEPHALDVQRADGALVLHVARDALLVGLVAVADL